MKSSPKKTTGLSAEDIKLLSRHFQIPPPILQEAKLERISDTEARKRGFYCKEATEPFDGIYFPYLTSGGQMFNARLRRDVCETKDDGEPANKYLMLPKRIIPSRGLYMLPADRKRLIEASAAERKRLQVVVVEAEKSVLAATAWARRAKRRDIIFAATGGCRSYNTPDLELLRGIKIDVLWDSNVWTNKDPQDAEPKFVNLLKQEYRADAGVRRLPRESRAEGINGPDDYIAKKKDAAFARLIDEPRAEPWLDMVGITWEEYSSTQAPRMAINGFLQEGGVTLFGGLPSAMKTWVMLSMVRALLTGNRLFGYFPVGVDKANAPPRMAERVIYLTPEVGLPMFKQRLELMKIGSYIKSRKLLIRTLSQTRIELTDPHLLRAVEGAHVFLDTIVRFTSGDENDNKANDAGLSTGCFGLLQAGALTVVGAHHARKTADKEPEMTLENMFRGAGDIGAFVRTAYGLKKLSGPSDKTSARVLVACVKPGDFTSPDSFVLEGRPSIDDGIGMKMLTQPGQVADREAVEKRGRPETPDKAARVDWLKRHILAQRKAGKKFTFQSLADDLASVREFKHTKHTKDTIARWLKEDGDEAKALKAVKPEGGE